MTTLTQAVDAVNALTTTVDTKIQDIDNRVAAKEAQVDSYLAGARGEQSHFRLTKNQALAGATGAPPTGWASHSSCSYELVETVVDGLVHESRSALAQEFLEVMYPGGAQYIYRNFNIWRMTWTNTPPYSMYQRSTAAQLTTSMAICKLVSGSINYYWAEGAEIGVCKVTGMQLKYGHLGYIHCHPIPQTPTGELLFALPAVVTGYVDLTDGNSFGMFPYIGDTQND